MISELLIMRWQLSTFIRLCKSILVFTCRYSLLKLKYTHQLLSQRCEVCISGNARIFKDDPSISEDIMIWGHFPILGCSKYCQMCFTKCYLHVQGIFLIVDDAIDQHKTKFNFHSSFRPHSILLFLIFTITVNLLKLDSLYTKGEQSQGGGRGGFGGHPPPPHGR